MEEEWPTKEVLAHRYQNQPWHIKLWRNRWTLMVPVWFLRSIGKKYSDGSVLHPKFVWSICRGTAHHKMDWWYTMDEVEERIEEKFVIYDY
jgi:hypothetical protein